MRAIGETQFSAEALSRSIAFDPCRELRGEGAEALIVKLMGEVLRGEGGEGSCKAPRDLRFKASANVLTANLLAAARNRIDSGQFVAISFRRADYAGSALSSTALAALRDALFSAGYIEGKIGGRPSPESGASKGRAMRTRIRAAPKLLDAFKAFGVDRELIVWRQQRDVIVMRSPRPGLGPEPLEVTASRRVLQTTVARIASSAVVLPEDAWSRVIARYRSERRSEPESGAERLKAGDVSATSLYRVFKGDWDCGGRLYGGWWINLPKIERSHLTIQGERVVELDYARLHPTLLFARTGVELTFDPYDVPGFGGPEGRALGKRTFNRLINKRLLAGGNAATALFALPQDRAALPKGVAYSSYLGRFIERLSPIAAWFGTGEGVRLQREDSDLAVDVIKAMDAQSIAVLPVHDSFIVARSYETALRGAMISAFKRRYGFSPHIRPERLEAQDPGGFRTWDAP